MARLILIVSSAAILFKPASGGGLGETTPGTTLGTPPTLFSRHTADWALLGTLESRGLPARAEFWDALALNNAEMGVGAGTGEGEGEEGLSSSSKTPVLEPGLWEITGGGAALSAARSGAAALYAALTSAPVPASVAAAASAAAALSDTRKTPLAKRLSAEWRLAAVATDPAVVCTSLIRLAEWRLFFDSFALPRSAVASLPNVMLLVPTALSHLGRLGSVSASHFSGATLLDPKGSDRAAWERKEWGSTIADENADENAGKSGAGTFSHDFSNLLHPHFGQEDDRLLASLPLEWEPVSVSFATQDDAIRALALGVGICHAQMIDVANLVMEEGGAPEADGDDDGDDDEDRLAAIFEPWTQAALYVDDDSALGGQGANAVSSVFPGPFHWYYRINLRHADVVSPAMHAVRYAYEDGLASLALLHLARVVVHDEEEKLVAGVGVGAVAGAGAGAGAGAAAPPLDTRTTRAYRRPSYLGPWASLASRATAMLASLFALITPTAPPPKPPASCVPWGNNASATVTRPPLPLCGLGVSRPFPNDDTAWHVLGALASRHVQVAQIALGARALGGGRGGRGSSGWWEFGAENSNSESETTSAKANATATCERAAALFLHVAARAAASGTAAMRSSDDAAPAWQSNEDAGVGLSVSIDALNIGYLRAQAAAGDDAAAVHLAQLMMRGGGGVDQDVRGALDLLEGAAGVHLRAAAPGAPPHPPLRLPEGGPARAAAVLAAVLSLQEEGAAGRDANRTFALLEAAAVAGDGDAISALGFLYQTGELEGVPINNSAAALWLRKAAVGGNPQARSNLAALLLRAPRAGTAQVAEEAAVWGSLVFNAHEAREHLQAALAQLPDFFLPAEFNLALIDLYGWDVDEVEDETLFMPQHSQSSSITPATPSAASAAVWADAAQTLAEQVMADFSSVTPPNSISLSDADLAPLALSRQAFVDAHAARAVRFAATRAQGCVAAADRLARVAIYGGEWVDDVPYSRERAAASWEDARKGGAGASAGGDPVAAAASAAISHLVLALLSVDGSADDAGFLLERDALRGRFDVLGVAADVARDARALSETASAAAAAATAELQQHQESSTGNTEKGSDGKKTVIVPMRDRVRRHAALAARADAAHALFSAARIDTDGSVGGDGDGVAVYGRALLSFWPPERSRGVGVGAGAAPSARTAASQGGPPLPLPLGDGMASVAAYLTAALGAGPSRFGEPIVSRASRADGHPEYRLASCIRDKWPGTPPCFNSNLSAASSWLLASAAGGDFAHAAFALARAADANGDIAVAWQRLDETLALDVLAAPPVALARAALLAGWFTRAAAGDARARADASALAAGLADCAQRPVEPPRDGWAVSMGRLFFNLWISPPPPLAAYLSVHNPTFDPDDTDAVEDAMAMAVEHKAQEQALEVAREGAFGDRHNVGPLPLSLRAHRLVGVLMRTHVALGHVVSVSIIIFWVCICAVRNRGLLTAFLSLGVLLTFAHLVFGPVGGTHPPGH